jgi:hypothetical protein
MGFFSDLKEEFGHQQIQNNGLPQSTGWQKCDECRFRMFDNRTIRSTGHYFCYIHQMRVGANQICGKFSKGEPEYEVR